MLQWPRCLPIDVSDANALIVRSLIVPFPWGSCWRRIWHQRRLLKASRAREHTRDTCSSAPSPRGQDFNCQLSSTKAGRSASSISPTCSPSHTAEGPMSAGTVSRRTQLWSVVLQVQLPLNLDNFKHYLACHLDRQWSESLLQGIWEGVDIGYQGNRKMVWSGKCKLALDNRPVVSEYLTTELALGRKAGPFNHPPSYICWVTNGIVVKKHSDSVKYHIIHDLSWPPRDSVNDHINPDLYCCVYASCDQAVFLVKKHGLGSLMAKLDLANAFKHILVHPQDWPLLCRSWDGSLLDGSVQQQYYVNLFLPFGLHNSPAIFNQYADVLEFAMWVNGISDLLHYLDNYFTAGPLAQVSASITSAPW